MFALEEVMLAFVCQRFPRRPFERIDATLTQKGGSSGLLLPLEHFGRVPNANGPNANGPKRQWSQTPTVPNANGPKRQARPFPPAPSQPRASLPKLYVGTTELTARTSSLSHSLATTGSRESERPS